ncbi:MAG TPA: DMT family transporter [Steroidobacteraceae bacterium]
MIQRKRLDAGASFALIGLCMLWGLAQVAIKVGNSGISPLLQAGLRSTGSTVLVLVWCWWRGIRLIERDGTLLPGVAAGLLFTTEFLLLYWGLAFTTAARSTIFLNSSPFFVALGAHLVIAGDRFSVTKVVGLIAAFAGVVVAFSDHLSLSSPRALIGDAMCLGGAAAWGATTVLIKATSLSRIAPERTLAYQLVVSSVVLCCASWLIGEAGVTNPSPLVISALLYQIVGVAFLSYLVWFWLIAHYPASQVASFVFLTPVFGVLAGALLLHDHVSIGLIAALALIAIGIYIINRPAPATVD